MHAFNCKCCSCRSGRREERRTNCLPCMYLLHTSSKEGLLRMLCHTPWSKPSPHCPALAIDVMQVYIYIYIWRNKCVNCHLSNEPKKHIRIEKRASLNTEFQIFCSIIFILINLLRDLSIALNHWWFFLLLSRFNLYCIVVNTDPIIILWAP